MHRVTALYRDAEKARLARGDLIVAGVRPDAVALVDDRIEVQARDMDQAIDVRAYLEQDGADGATIHGGADAPGEDTMPAVPAVP